MTLELDIWLTGARGGHGTSTIAAALAVIAAEHHRTELISPDPPSALAHLGFPELADPALNAPERLTVMDQPTGAPAVRIHEHADRPPNFGAGRAQLVVLRGPCYLGLRTLTRRRAPVDGLIVLVEQGRSLSTRDAEDVAGIPVVATIPVTVSAARCIDAGLLASRARRMTEFRQLRAYASELLSAPLTGPHALGVPPEMRLDASVGSTHSMSGTELPVPQAEPADACLLTLCRWPLESAHWRPRA